MKSRLAPSKALAAEIPDVVIQRLPVYARTLNQLAREGIEVVSSFRLGELLGSTPAQIRKDLSYFGRFGKQGTGYNVAYLQGRLKQILGLEKEWPMALVGVGRLGQAIARYPGFAAAGFRIAALFDTDPEKVGKRVEGTVIQSVEEMPRALRASGIEIAILAVPAERAQPVTDLLLQGGVKAIVSYAPVSLRVPEETVVRSIDPVLVLQSMTFYLDQA
ncbi:MAG TPA: redox-sensing transcriptional repressor Rex [Dehalococcoidia bacterium]|nr:redox-sensing transcriptional repressor Rex [Dehalococcoidia bacterium]